MAERTGREIAAQPTEVARHRRGRHQAPQEHGRIGRRGVLFALAGAGASAAACMSVATTADESPLDVLRRRKAPPPPANLTSRPAGERPLDGGAYPDRDASYASGAMSQGSPQGGVTLSGPAEAAARADVAKATLLATDDPALHLLRRTTFGITPTELADVRAVGIDRWLQTQLEPASVPDPDADRVWAAYRTVDMNPVQIRGAIKKHSWDAMNEYAQATLTRQLWSRRQVFEVMVDFWANHLNMPMPSDSAWDVGTSYHNDVIRAHALGSFTDMLLAAMRHPAMLSYLDNNKSTKTAVNENLGRELLELHTVGVGGGYTEDDVRNSAYILTGRTIDGDTGAFRYDPKRHWTGAVTVLDFSHPNPSAAGGLDVGDAYLRHLAAHPATARSIARKLAVRFVADNPPAELVDRLADVYLKSGTAIHPVLWALFSSTEFWASVGQKTRRPLENVVASARVLGVGPGANHEATKKGINGMYWSLDQLGHRPLAWGPPNGYPDVQPAWASAGGMLQQWNRHRALVQGWWKELGHTKPEQLVQAGTVGEFVDGLCDRLLFQRMLPAHREALLAFLGEPADKAFARSNLKGMAGHLAPLVLDSPYFALR
jgi:uncharacterized protein (DUF1800 family)